MVMFVLSLLNVVIFLYNIVMIRLLTLKVPKLFVGLFFSQSERHRGVPGVLLVFLLLTRSIINA